MNSIANERRPDIMLLPSVEAGLSTGRRAGLALAASALALAMTRTAAQADIVDGRAASEPIKMLDDALIAAMETGAATTFEQRYQRLAPVIVQVFDLDAVLAASIGLAWAGIPDAQKAMLAVAFQRYTVSSYVANFDSYAGQHFELQPSPRAVDNGEMVVPTRLIRRDQSPVRLDYVMRSRAGRWRVVDVLTDGSISRVAVQRSDFRRLLVSGGPAALAAGLQRKVARLSGGMQG